MFVVDNLTVEQIPQVIPKDILSHSSLGLMASRKPYAVRNSVSSLFASLGAGAPAAGLEPELQCSSPQLTPNRIPDCMKNIVRLNKTRNTPGLPGLLADTLRNANIRETLYSDNPSIFPIAANSDGSIDFRPLSELDDTPSTTSPRVIIANSHIETPRDIPPIAKRIRHYLNASPASDSHRIIFLFPRSGFRHDAPDLGETAIVQGDPLFPVVISAPGIQSGYLRSSTTRLNGLIVSIDIAPTILEILGVPKPQSMSGSPATAAMTNKSPGVAHRLRYLRKLADGASLHDRLIGPATVSVVIWGYALIVGAMLLLTLGAPKSRVAAALMLTPPLTLLYTYTHVLFGYMSLFPWLVGFAAFAFAGMFLTLRLFRDPLRAFLCVSLVTIFVFLIDMFCGLRIGASSYLGLSLLTGSRYYGVGNEMLSCVMASAIFAAGLMVQFSRNRRAALSTSAALLIAIAFAAGHPALGANLGGLLSSSFCFAFTWLALARSRGFIKNVLLSGFIAIALSALIIFSGRFIAEPSHISRFGAMFLQSSGDVATGLLHAKLRLHGALIHFIMITCYGWAGASLGFFLIWRLRSRILSAVKPYPDLQSAFVGILLAILAAFLLNDTGITMLFLMAYYVMSLVLILIHTESSEPASEPQNTARN